jgi:multicomponent Na+:H+ antiporter subunit E
MLKKLINLSSLLRGYLYRVLFFLFTLLLIKNFISISYISIVVLLITYFFASRFKLNIGVNISLLHLIRYFGFILKELFISTINVTRIIWSKENKVNEDFGAIITINDTEFGIALFANSISLTPGTVTVNIDKKNLLVHALDRNSIEELKKSDMDKRIKEICI